MGPGGRGLLLPELQSACQPLLLYSWKWDPVITVLLNDFFYSYKSDNSLFVKLVTVEKHKHKTFPFRNPQIFAINILVHVLSIMLSLRFFPHNFNFV